MPLYGHIIYINDLSDRTFLVTAKMETVKDPNKAERYLSEYSSTGLVKTGSSDPIIIQ